MSLPREECQVCAKTQSVRNGTLVNHGYTRPGWGWIVGGCPGVHHRPFPETDALEATLPHLEEHILLCRKLATQDEVTFTISIGRSWYEGRTRCRHQRNVSSLAEWKALEFDDQTDRAEHWNFRDEVQYDYHVKRYRAGRSAEAESTEAALEWTLERIAKGEALRG